jgi:hypothetical protein
LSLRERRSGLAGRAAAALLLASALTGPTPRAAAEPVAAPTPQEFDQRFATGQALTGREIYERFVRNRFRTMTQHLKIVSTDPGGNAQEVQVRTRWKDYAEVQDPAVDGVKAKTLVRFVEPFDLGLLTYLTIHHDNGELEQFVARPGLERARRIQVRGVGLMGTDFMLEDVAFPSIENGRYERLPDSLVGDTPVYVVRVTLNEDSPSQRRIVTAWIETERYVLLRADYADAAGVVLREWRADVESIREFDGVWVPTVSTMRNVKQDTSSTLTIEALVPNPELPERLFSKRQLTERRW